MNNRRNIKKIYEERKKFFKETQRLLLFNKKDEENIVIEENRVEEEINKLKKQKEEHLKKIKDGKLKIKKELEYDKKIEKLIEEKIKKLDKKEKISQEKMKLLSDIQMLEEQISELCVVMKNIEEKEKLFKKRQEARKKEEEKKKENKRKEEEEKKLASSLERQKLFGNEEIDNNSNNNINDNSNNDINDNSNDNINDNSKLRLILEEMCIMGDITKETILKEKDNEDKYISIEEAIQLMQKQSPTEDDEELFILGVLAQILEDNGISTLIERNKNNPDENNQEENYTPLDFLLNGLMNKSKYAFNFDFGEIINNKLLTDENEQKTFNNKLLKSISLQLGVPENEIIVTCPQEGSYIIHVIFLSEEFDNLNPEELKNKIKEDIEFKELFYLKDIQKKVILDAVKLTRNIFDFNGNQTTDGYSKGQKRGTYDYFPPIGWKAFGLKVLDKYDEGNNDWIAKDGNENEWAVAYHGIVGSIFNPEDNEKIYKEGNGIYVSPKIEYIEQNEYAGKSNTKINGKTFKMAFMLRVKPDKIRTCSTNLDEWILEQEEIRPYRLLLKEEE